MARKPRFNAVGFPLHVIQRGNNRQACFFSQADYHRYLGALKRSSENHSCEIHAYVLMTNHVHLVLTPGHTDSVSRLMQAAGSRYVQYVNRRYERTGTLWEGRYHASLVDTERYLLTCYRYVEMNPVRAKLVKSPGSYRWSSYRRNAFGERNDVIAPHVCYLNLGRSSTARCRAYREAFCDGLDEETLKAIRDGTNQELVLGTDQFKHRIERLYARQARRRKSGRPRKKIKELKNTL